MESSTLIVPVESRVRELDAKVLLAAVAAERGFPVVLGSRQEVNFAVSRLPRGVFFAKSMRFTSDRMSRIIQGLGHHMVAADEESLVRFSSPEYYAWRFSPQSFRPLRHLFAWGPDDAAMFCDYPERGDVSVHVAGNPRVDLLRKDVRCLFAEDAARLRERYGRFILINTNFPFVNAFVKELSLIQRNGRAYLRHRFAPLTAEDVQSRLTALQRRLNRFDGITARPLGQDVFAIEPHNRAARVN